MKFYEKLIILIVLFLGVTIGTAAIIGTYVKTVSSDQKTNQQQSIIVENISLLELK